MGGPIMLPACFLFCALDSATATSAALQPAALKPGRKPLSLFLWPFISGSREHDKQMLSLLFCFQSPIALDVP